MKIMKSARTQRKVTATLASRLHAPPDPLRKQTDSQRGERKGREWRRLTDRPWGEEGEGVRKEEVTGKTKKNIKGRVDRGR